MNLSPGRENTLIIGIDYSAYTVITNIKRYDCRLFQRGFSISKKERRLNYSALIWLSLYEASKRPHYKKVCKVAITV